MNEDDGTANLPESAPEPEDPEAEENKGQGQPTAIMRSMMAMMGSVTNPLLEKIESKHIDRALELGDKHADRERTSEKEARFFFAGGGVLVLGFLIFLVIFLASDTALLLQLLFPILTFIAGLGAGWGIGSRSR